MRSTAFVLGATTILMTMMACGDVGPGVAIDGSMRSVVCGATPVEVLPNGSFDLSTPPWLQDPPTPAQLCGMPTITPADGTTAACMGGQDGVTQTLSQPISLPAGVKTLTLTGQICISTQETVAADNDTLVFDVVNGSATVATLGMRSNQQGASACSFGAFTLTAAASSDPATATFRIRSTLNTTKTTSWFIDKLSLTASCN